MNFLTAPSVLDFRRTRGRVRRLEVTDREFEHGVGTVVGLEFEHRLITVDEDGVVVEHHVQREL